MDNRNIFIAIIIIVIIAPGFYHFIGGEQFEQNNTRNMLVVAQIVAGFVLIWMASGKKWLRKNEDSNNTNS